MPRGRTMMPGFGNLTLGIPPPGQKPYVELYQEGTGVRPPPVPVAPLPPAGQVAGQVAGAVPVAPDQALAARAGVPAQAIQTPEQMGVADSAKQAAMAVRPSGFIKSDPLAYGQPRIQLPVAVNPLMPSPMDVLTNQVMGRPALGPVPVTPGVPAQQWGTVAPGRRPEDMIPVAPMPAPGAQVQVPMRNPDVPVPVTPAPAEQAGPVVDVQQGRMTITPGDIEGLSRYGSETDRKRMEALKPLAERGNAKAQEEYTAIKSKLEGLQGEQQEKQQAEKAAEQRKRESESLGAEIDILKGDEADAQKAVDQLKKESKDRDVADDLALAEQRLKAAQEATRGAMSRRADVLRPVEAKRLPVGPAPVTGAKAGALALEALGIRLGPAMKEQVPQAKKDAQSAARVGGEVVGRMGRAVESAILGGRMRVAVGIDNLGQPVYADSPDPRKPGLFDGKRLTYKNIEAAAESLRTGFGEATGGVGKQEADLDVTRKAALVSWLAQNRHRPEMQEGISEWARKNKADWERFAKSIPIMDPAGAAAPQGAPRQPGELTIGSMKTAAGETAGTQTPAPGMSGGYAVTPRVRTEGTPLVTEPGAPRTADLDRPGISIPKPGALPKGAGQSAPPETLMDALRRTDKSLPRAQRMEEARRLLRDAGWKVGAASS